MVGTKDKSTKRLIQCYLLLIYITFSSFEARADIQKCFHCFLVQVKSLKFAFEINWPLRNSKKSSWPVTGLWNRGSLKILNSKLILDDQGNHLDSYTISSESFRSFWRSPIPQTCNRSQTFFYCFLQQTGSESKNDCNTYKLNELVVF